MPASSNMTSCLLYGVPLEVLVVLALAMFFEIMSILSLSAVNPEALILIESKKPKLFTSLR
ncbi:hypothetical protein SDC9_190409 [bioreactor metagenome]|uniref:Uncharacterized protein n=1 Tax=bioreactor metagenome TaxID=1076179 RepID=A0A645HUW6_9ZZZZ